MPTTTPEDLVYARLTRPRRPPVLRTLLSLALAVLLIGVVLPWLLDVSWPQILRVVGAADPLLVGVMVLVGAGTLLCEVGALRAAMLPLRGAEALRLGTALQALALAVPGGGPIGIAALLVAVRRRGVSVADALTGVAILSLMDLLLSSLLPLVGAVALTIADAGPLWLRLVLAVSGVLGLGLGGAVLALLLRPGSLDGVLARLEFLPPESARELVRTQQFRSRRLLAEHGLAVAGLPVASRLLQLVAWFLALAATGVAVGPAAAIGVFALGRSLAQLPLTPGGTGITEAASAAALSTLGVDAAEAAAASLLPSLALVVLPLVLGAFTAPTLLRRER
ncbi:flippase-like domain-containing protein [Brachybacterium sp. EF45031]|uniref:flippase-like domain-containing protein n=1 Tax=Brachybacterium sillae TaxID=2810536 RepID=UPI00217D9117|nr:flippase-like domain-containing protein [Brachybacterium sillae]MCS6711338.1 flippase-like domain-containing protein [Brachybacterium sillae]